VKTHREIEERSLALARAIVAKIDDDPQRRALQHARAVCARWQAAAPAAAVAEWLGILQQDWRPIRAALLDESERGQRLRQSNPFCGVLTPQERWAIYRRFSHEQIAA